MIGVTAGFDWDAGNLEKCRRHGVSTAEIEGLFERPLAIRPDSVHSQSEGRFAAIGRSSGGRWIFLAFTLRQRDGKAYIRPISARYMHRKEIKHYAEEVPDL